MWRPGFSCLFRICRAAADFLKQRGAAGTAGVTQSDAGEGVSQQRTPAPDPRHQGEEGRGFCQENWRQRWEPGCRLGAVLREDPCPEGARASPGSCHCCCRGAQGEQKPPTGLLRIHTKGGKEKTALLHNYMLLAKCSRVIWAMRMNGLRQAERIMIIIIVQKY